MKVNPNQTVEVSSAEAINASRLAKLGLKPLDYVVQRTATLTHALAKWTIIYLGSPVNAVGKINPAVLVIQDVDGQKAAYLYEDSGLASLNRASHVEAGNFFLFQQPEDENNFKFNDLKLTLNIHEDKDTGEAVDYTIVANEFTGQISENPQRSGLSNLMGTIANYVSKDGRRAMLLEIGEADNSNGGLINLYTGYELKLSEIKVY